MLARQLADLGDRGRKLEAAQEVQVVEGESAARTARKAVRPVTGLGKAPLVDLADPADRADSAGLAVQADGLVGQVGPVALADDLIRLVADWAGGRVHRQALAAAVARHRAAVEGHQVVATIGPVVLVPRPEADRVRHLAVSAPHLADSGRRHAACAGDPVWVKPQSRRH